MVPKISFKKFIDPKALVPEMNKMAPLHTPVLDLIYPAGVQINHPMSVVAYEDIVTKAKNIPLITRGSSSYSLKADGGKFAFIMPQELKPSKFISDATLNDLRALGEGAQKQFALNEVDKLRRATRASKEALAVQSLTGKIAYPIRNDNGEFEKFEVSFGTPKKVTLSKKWDDTSYVAASLVADVGKMVAEINKDCNATKFVGFMDFDTFAAIAKLCMNCGDKLPITVEKDKIIISGVELYATAETYYDYVSKKNIPVVQPKFIKVIGVDDGFKFFNCSVDSAEANFQPLPFVVKELRKEDPDGLKLIGNSKPLPAPNADAICDCQVLK